MKYSSHSWVPLVSILMLCTATLTTGAQLPLPAVAMQFVKIQPGEYMMGCSVGDNHCEDDEKPAHRVRIAKAFELGKYEVTQAQWEAVMGSNNSNFKGADLPVDRVGWNAVQDFLDKLNARKDGYQYRLPTEAEWEYAARAGTVGPFAGSLDAVAWYAGNSGKQTHPVGQKQPNAWGLYDMLGNVREWVQDWYAPDYYAHSPLDDPKGPTSGKDHILRGGSWLSDDWNSRVSLRWSNGSIGFRCAREKAQ